MFKNKKYEFFYVKLILGLTSLVIITGLKKLELNQTYATNIDVLDNNCEKANDYLKKDVEKEKNILENRFENLKKLELNQTYATNIDVLDNNCEKTNDYLKKDEFVKNSSEQKELIKFVSEKINEPIANFEKFFNKFFNEIYELEFYIPPYKHSDYENMSFLNAKSATYIHEYLENILNYLECKRKKFIEIIKIIEENFVLKKQKHNELNKSFQKEIKNNLSKMIDEFKQLKNSFDIHNNNITNSKKSEINLLINLFNETVVKCSSQLDIFLKKCNEKLNLEKKNSKLIKLVSEIMETQINELDKILNETYEFNINSYGIQQENLRMKNLCVYDESCKDSFKKYLNYLNEYVDSQFYSIRRGDLIWKFDNNQFVDLKKSINSTLIKLGDMISNLIKNFSNVRFLKKLAKFKNLKEAYILTKPLEDICQTIENCKKKCDDMKNNVNELKLSKIFLKEFSKKLMTFDNILKEVYVCKKNSNIYTKKLSELRNLCFENDDKENSLVEYLLNFSKYLAYQKKLIDENKLVLKFDNNEFTPIKQNIDDDLKSLEKIILNLFNEFSNLFNEFSNKKFVKKQLYCGKSNKNLNKLEYFNSSLKKIYEKIKQCEEKFDKLKNKTYKYSDDSFEKNVKNYLSFKEKNSSLFYSSSSKCKNEFYKNTYDNFKKNLDNYLPFKETGSSFLDSSFSECENVDNSFISDKFSE